MFAVFKLKNIIKLLIVLAIIIFSVLLFYWSNEAVDAVEQDESKPYTLVLDPGHGGIDGGAIGADGTKESDINLSIALKARDLALFCGFDCVLTRNDDSDELGGAPYSERNSLLERAEIANRQENAILIIVHQNTFPNELPSGAEVMYSKALGSERLAKITQENLVSQLDPDNRRVARPAPDELLLTSRAECPSILVECGFMSNPAELSKLCTDEYRAKIALVLVASYLQFSADELRV